MSAWPTSGRTSNNTSATVDLFDFIHDITEMIEKPVPDEMREAGFEQTRKSKINEHKPLLTDLWDQIRISGA